MGGPAAEWSTPDGLSDADERSIEQLRRRLQAEFPDVPGETVRAHITDSLRATADARVQAYRGILAERAARRRLVAACQRSDDGATVSVSDADAAPETPREAVAA